VFVLSCAGRDTAMGRSLYSEFYEPHINKTQKRRKQLIPASLGCRSIQIDKPIHAECNPYQHLGRESSSNNEVEIFS
jgi:hypothetical protein